MAVDAPAEEELEAAEAAAKAPIADCDGDKDVGQEMEAPEAAAESLEEERAPSAQAPLSPEYLEPIEEVLLAIEAERWGNEGADAGPKAETTQ